MNKIRENDIVTILPGRFQVSLDNGDGTFDLLPLTEYGDRASERAIEYVSACHLQRIARTPRIGDVYQVTAEPFSNDELVVVFVGRDGSVKLYSTHDETTYSTTADDLDDEKYYTKVRGEH